MDKIREAFEKWAKTECLDLDSIDGFYSGNDTHIAWGAWKAAKSAAVPVVGEPTDAAYKWMIANGVEPLTSLHKLGERLAAFLDEDQFSGCETLLLTAITAINTFVPVPAAELATLREKAAMVDELRECNRVLSLSEVILNEISEKIKVNGAVLIQGGGTLANKITNRGNQRRPRNEL